VASCKDVCNFLGQVSARAVTTPLADADTARLADLQLVRVLSADELRALNAQLAELPAGQAALAQEAGERAEVASELKRDYSRTHSILFHLHGKD